MNTLQGLFFLGRPFGPLYGLTMRLRARLYAEGHFKSHRMPVPVISVGNLVLGGSGKTPMVRHLAELLQNHGHRPAIISRGYGGNAKESANVVSDGVSVLLSPEEGGDEPCMLAHALPGVPVLVGRRRVHPCRLAIDKHRADVLLLDDGFQHLAVHRDLDLVLFDGSTLAGTSRIFPAGTLREPIAALQRADAIIFTGVTAENRSKARSFGDTLAKVIGERPIFMASLAPPELRQIYGSPSASSPAFCFCGIANPERFRQTAASLGLPVVGFLSLPDHIRYTPQMLDGIIRRATACGARQLLTTSKDYVKLRQSSLSFPLGVVDIKMQPQPELDEFLLRRLSAILSKKFSTALTRH